jgi:REP element-mobilizing transposase RayT
MTFREIEKWLDRAEWVVHLQNPAVAEMVVEAIEHRQQIGDWDVFEYTVMPTHIHLFCEIGRKGLKATLEDFKRWTGHQAAKILAVDGERFWQREWFDHWSRSDLEDDRIVQYIRNNPVKAGLVTDPAEWRYSSAGRRK